MRISVSRFTFGLGALVTSSALLVGLTSCGSSSTTGGGGGSTTGGGGSTTGGTGGKGGDTGSTTTGSTTTGSGGAAQSCSDGSKNGAETDVDCGGPSCDKCALGKACDVSGDCAEGACIGGTCQIPSAGCMDGSKNGSETDVDCGGAACPTCEDGKTCGSEADCTNGVCANGVCASPTCDDGSKNGSETDVDCGGGTCGKCADGKICAGNADCQNDSCVGNVCAMVMPTCNDNVKNGSETDVDCGGGTCFKCASGQTCGVNADCQSSSCVGGTCVPGMVGHIWSKRYGDFNEQDCFVVKTDSSDNILLSMYTNGFLDFGAGPIGAANFGQRVTLAKLEPSSAQIWARWYQDGTKQYPYGMDLDAAGNLFIAGTYVNTMKLGPPVGNLVSAGAEDIFAFKVDAAGTPVWGKSFGDASTLQRFRAATTDLAGNPVMTGELTGGADFGGGAFNGNNTDIIVVKLDKNTGGHIWSKKYGNANTQRGDRVVVDANGNVIVVGYLNGAVDFGGGNIGSAGNNVFLLKLDANGNYVWAKAFASTQNESKPHRIAVDAAGNIFIAGPKWGNIDFGGGLINTVEGGPGLIYDAYLAKFAPNGNHLWSKDFGDGENQWIEDVTVDGGGNVVVVGSMMGTVDFGGGNLTALGGTEFGGDVFVAKFSTAGNWIFSQRYGDAAYQLGRSITVDSTGAAVLCGQFKGTINFGGANLTSMGVNDIFLAKIALP